ncbi:hypothetical protein D3C78_1269170 [compost metagenome]
MLQGGLAILASHVAFAEEALQAAVQRLPDRHQPLVLLGRGLRQEILQAGQGGQCLVHAPADHQGAGVEEDQVRGTLDELPG